MSSALPSDMSEGSSKSKYIGYSKVYDMLKSGGVFARFANHPYRDKGNIVLSEEIEKL